MPRRSVLRVLLVALLSFSTLVSTHGGEWAQAAKLVAADGAAEDNFGCSVSVSGSTVVVGAHFDDDAGDNSGSGYIWMLSIPSLRPCTCCERSMKSMGFTVGAEDCDPEATPDDLDFQSSR